MLGPWDKTAGARRSWPRWLSLVWCCLARSSSARRVANVPGATAAQTRHVSMGRMSPGCARRAPTRSHGRSARQQAERLRPLVAADRRLRQLVRELEALALSEVEELLG